MSKSFAAHDLAELPEGGDPLPHRQADRRGVRLSPTRPEAPSISSYVTALMIAAGLIFAWAGICWI
jgi:hypothetical protein